MFRPTEAKTLENYKIWVKYGDGIEGTVDLSHLAGKGVFSLWNDYKEFEKVFISKSGAIAWTDQVDICPDSIYMQITGKSPEELFPALKNETINA